MRYIGTLHKICESAPHKKGGWNDLLSYLEVSSTNNPKALTPAFDSPLPPLTSASDGLLKELIEKQGPRKEDTPLRILCRHSDTPPKIIAACLHLGPDAAKFPDSKGRLPLHWACKRPTIDKLDEQALVILVQAYPSSLLHRDEGGRTPLHYLFWHHASTRSVRLVEYFVQALPQKLFARMSQPGGRNLPEIPTPNTTAVPPTAAIVFDSKFGCLPLHYAVMQGANKDVIKTLIQAYPSSRILGDANGRTALHWYLGAAGEHHVSGETPDHNAPALYLQKRSSSIIALLLSSKVTRLIDEDGRLVLHWAASMLGLQYYHGNERPMSLKVIQSLLDYHIEGLTTRDGDGMTPLHVLFQEVILAQQEEFEKPQRRKYELHAGGGLPNHPTFTPPTELMEFLLRTGQQTGEQRTHGAAHVEDNLGRLPLHLCTMTASSPATILLILQANPTSLVHTSEDFVQTPLHTALSGYMTPMQSKEGINHLLQAYVTSRHGTFVNGKLALKMEDGQGNYPLHLAAQQGACLEVVQLLLETYPKAAKIANGNGELPLHALLDVPNLFSTEPPKHVTGVTMAPFMGWIPVSDYEKTRMHVLSEKVKSLTKPLLKDDLALEVEGQCGMLPLHIAVALDAVEYSDLYQMIDSLPSSAMAVTHSSAGQHQYCALDLHEMRQAQVPSDGTEKWNNIRELLFAFGPMVASHRLRDDLLEQCARVVREEADGSGSYHSKEFFAWMKGQLNVPDLELKETLSSIDAPEVDHQSPRPVRPSSTRSKNKNKRITSPAAGSKTILPSIEQLKNTLSPKEQSRAKKSIYDNDEFDHRYTMSMDEEDDEEEDEYFDEEIDLEDEEYNADDDSRYHDDDFDDDDERTYGDDSRTYDSKTLGSRTFDSRTYDSRTFDDDTRTYDSRNSRKSYRPGERRMTPRGSVDDDRYKSFEEEKKAEENDSEEIEAPFLSDVAMRLWTFFVLYNNASNARDNYSKTVEMILEELPYSTVKELSSLLLPPYAKEYISGYIGGNQTLENMAHDACKGAIHVASYFVGRYDFVTTSNDSLVIDKSNDGMTIQVRATEHLLTTEILVAEVLGKAEETVWKTGEKPDQIGDTVESVFAVTSRKVCIKFMRSRQAYEREVQCRRDLGITVKGEDRGKNFVVPLINHFSASGSNKREVDKRFQFDIQDDRFKTISLGCSEFMTPSEFPYAVVFPFRENGNLYEMFLHNGQLQQSEIRAVGLQIGRALQAVHKKGLVHGGITLSNITMVNVDELSEVEEPYWALTELAGTCKQSTSLLGGIPATGFANFMSCTFPPEMFARLSPSEVKVYESYWETVSKKYDVKIDPFVINPHVDPTTGDAYVLRCYFDSDEVKKNELPELPYRLVAAHESSDIWAFGRLLFTLCTAGHPMFATNIKTGHLLEYNQVAKWSDQDARFLIYKHVQDPLAQDLLFQLLCDTENRESMSMENVLSHPYFASDESSEIKGRSIVDKQTQESAKYVQSLQASTAKQAEGGWVSHRSKNVHCWDLGLSYRMSLAPSNLLREGIHNAPLIPCSFVLLPYKLVRNKHGKLTPSNKQAVELAEKMGIQLLKLAKAVQFACRMETVVEDPKNYDKTWSSTELLKAMALGGNDYSKLEALMSPLAAEEVERFRDDPLFVARKLVQQSIQLVQLCVQGGSLSYLYLVDEFSNTPILESPYPRVLFTNKLGNFFLQSLPLMLTTVLYSCGVAESTNGLVKLIFEAAHPHIPPSWANAATGLKFGLDKHGMLQQLQMLRSAVAGLLEVSVNRLDDVQNFQDNLQEADPKNLYANLERITNGEEAAIWTVQYEHLKERCADFDISHAYRKQCELERKVGEQAERIEILERALASAEFKRQHGLLDLD